MENSLTVFQEIDFAALLGEDPKIKSEHTRRGYRADLNSFQEWRGKRIVTKTLIQQYAAELQKQGKSPSTINRKLAAIRWYARRLADHIQDTHAENEQEEKQRAEMISQAERVASVEDVKSKKKIKGRHINPGELSALVAACEKDPSPAGMRDAALFAVAWQTGLRRDELANLAYSSFIPTGNEEADLIVRHTKGENERTVYINNGAFLWLKQWLEIRGDNDGYLFCVIGKSAYNDKTKAINPEKIKTDDSLSGESMRLILEKRIDDVGISPLTWHDFRRTFAGNLLDSGVDLVTVQKLMGHADPSTTSNYDRRGDETRRKAVKTLFVPFRGKKHE